MFYIPLAISAGQNLLPRARIMALADPSLLEILEEHSNIEPTPEITHPPHDDQEEGNDDLPPPYRARSPPPPLYITLHRDLPISMYRYAPGRFIPSTLRGSSTNKMLAGPQLSSPRITLALPQRESYHSAVRRLHASTHNRAPNQTYRFFFRLGLKHNGRVTLLDPRSWEIAKQSAAMDGGDRSRLVFLYAAVPREYRGPGRLTRFMRAAWERPWLDETPRWEPCLFELVGIGVDVL